MLDYLRFFSRHRSLDFAALALGNVYGPRQDPTGEAGVISIFASSMLAGRTPTIFGDGEQTRDYVYVEDTVAAFVAAMDRASGEVVNIGTGIETSVNALYAMLCEIVGIPPDPRYGPQPEGELRRIALDNSHAASVLGWSPRTDLAVGLARTVEHLRDVLLLIGRRGVGLGLGSLSRAHDVDAARPACVPATEASTSTSPARSAIVSTSGSARCTST